MVLQGKYSTVKAEINADSSSDLQAVKRLATYLHKPADKPKVVAEVKKMMESEMSMDNSTVALTSGIILTHEGAHWLRAYTPPRRSIIGRAPRGAR